VIKARGPENEEFQGEINGVASTLGIDVDEIHAIQMLYELNTLMIPLVNLTGPGFSEDVDLDHVANLLQAASPQATLLSQSALDAPASLQLTTRMALCTTHATLTSLLPSSCSR
jgi:hypothetical protein